jgi:hypothetical protein
VKKRCARSRTIRFCNVFPELFYFFSTVNWVSHNFHLLLVVTWELLFNAWANDAFI